MPKSHVPYPPEFKRRLVELVRVGRTPEELAEKFEPTAQSIRNWVVQADRDDGHRQDGLTSGKYWEILENVRATRRSRTGDLLITNLSRGCLNGPEWTRTVANPAG